ncbi:MAG: hypothetical protein ACRD6W_02000 [Nitrososphaerales archaeon]
MRIAVGLCLAVLQALLIELPRRTIGGMARAIRRGLSRFCRTSAIATRTVAKRAAGLASRGRGFVAQQAPQTRKAFVLPSRALRHAAGAGARIAAAKLVRGGPILRLRPDFHERESRLGDPFLTRRDLALRAISWLGLGAILVCVGVAIAMVGR